MDQPTKTTESNRTSVPTRDAVLCSIQTNDDIAAIAQNPKSLVQIGFTGIVIPDEVVVDIEPFRQLGLAIFLNSDIESGLNLSTFTGESSMSASEIWAEIDSDPPNALGVELTGNDTTSEAIVLLQMSVLPVPIVPVSASLLHAASHQERRELLRSAVFWRKRFDISRYTSSLVHAGEDGLLIFTIDSWLVMINQNDDEASIDLGSHGSMWLMLGTHRDVHLHGSMLILPPNSGAVVANELAR